MFMVKRVEIWSVIGFNIYLQLIIHVYPVYFDIVVS